MPPNQPNSEVIKKLVDLREQIAARSGLENFKVLQYRTIEAIAAARPDSLEELALVKGIGEKKLAAYGGLILEAVNGRGRETRAEKQENGEPRANVLTVSRLLDRVNDLFGRDLADLQVKGEITGLAERPAGYFFSLQDETDGSILPCYWPARNSGLADVLPAEGLAVKAAGDLNVYKPKGRLSLVVKELALVGEGALKKAYEILKAKLAAAGIFERKRPLPEFISAVGVITSRAGAVIHDFQRNLRPLGIKIYLLDVRVEGAAAAGEVSAAVDWFNRRRPELDALVIMRGGGGLEDLQAFNGERVARAIFASRLPVIAAIGHERDEPIACLAADKSVSTPTAAAVLVNESWRGLIDELPLLGRNLEQGFADILQARRAGLDELAARLRFGGQAAIAAAGAVFDRFYRGLDSLDSRRKDIWRAAGEAARALDKACQSALDQAEEKIAGLEKYLRSADPENNLKLGYGIITNQQGRVIRSARDLRAGDPVKAKLSEGGFESEVRKIFK